MLSAKNLGVCAKLNGGPCVGEVPSFLCLRTITSGATQGEDAEQAGGAAGFLDDRTDVTGLMSSLSGKRHALRLDRTPSHLP